jgi:hypothetical protein
MGNPRARCGGDGATFQRDLDTAIKTLRLEQAYLFDGNRVLNVGAYYVGLIRILDREGLCAGHDGEELGIKDSNDFNDVFDVLTSKDEVRSFYIGTCWPAIFPETAPVLTPPPAGCNLPQSYSVACGRDGDGRFTGEVLSAIEQVIREKPQLFDATAPAAGTDWPLLKDVAGYQNAVMAVLVQKGYCAHFDGEEIQLKRTNEFTDHYDVNYQDRYVRKGQGIYRGSCYPAAF